MHVANLQELAPDDFTRAALKEYIIRHDDSGPPVRFEQGDHVLEKIELFVAGAGPEIVTHNSADFTLLATFFIDKGHAAFTTKWGIGEHYIEIFPRMAAQAIFY